MKLCFSWLDIICPNSRQSLGCCKLQRNSNWKYEKGQEVTIKVDAYKNKTFKGKVDSIQRASGAKSSLFPPENAVGSFVKIVQRIPVKITFDEEIKKDEFNIVSGMSVVPKVKVK